jgi:hypothetical protein
VIAAQHSSMHVDDVPVDDAPDGRAQRAAFGQRALPATSRRLNGFGSRNKARKRGREAAVS